LSQANEGRKHILGEMNKVLKEANEIFRPESLANSNSLEN